MTNTTGKIMGLSEAVERFVFDGAHLSLGGFTINRNPMAAVYEIIRQGKVGLHIYAHSNGQGVDELIGAGCVSRVEIAYGGSGRFAPTCIRFKKAVQSGLITVEDYSNYQMTLRFLAGAMGVPFLPTRSSLGTSIIDVWGFQKEMRRSDTRIPDKKLCVMDNPFGTWGDVPKVVLVPAINPDVTIIHVQKAGPNGTVRIDGLTFADVEQAKAARYVIVTCESVVGSDEMRLQPDRNQIPFFCVDAVVPAPMGAYPTACYGHYDYDPVYLNNYREYALDDDAYSGYLDKFIHGVNDHASFVALSGEEQIQAIKADPRTGYAVGLERA